MKRIVSFLSLLTSFGTLVCCALPALLVVLGFGAAMAGFLNAFPQVVLISEHKGVVFLIGGVLLVLAGILQWRSQQLSCPPQADLAQACADTKDWSRKIYIMAVTLYLVGAFFAYLLPVFFSGE